MARPVIDVQINESMPKEILLAKHADFIYAYEQKEDCTLDYLKMCGIYWSLTTMDLIGDLSRMNKSGILNYVQQCQNSDGGIGPHPTHDSHLLSTLSAIQILATYDVMDLLDVDRVVKYIVELQQEDGSFAGDKWGERDTRFSFCAVATLRLLDRLDAIDTRKTVDHVLRCLNFDGGFGTRPRSESHAGQMYCCLGTLSILHQLRRINPDATGWWLAERQLPSGGLNGRPEKKPDVCYSWWVLSSLAILGRLSWIDGPALGRYILASQDEETGGIADCPGDYPDPFHTLFGLCGLSLLGTPSQPQLKPINPVFCMAQEVIDRLGIQVQILS